MPPIDELAGGPGNAEGTDGAGSGTGTDHTGGASELPGGSDSDGGDSSGGARNDNSEGNADGGDGPARSMGKDDPISAAARATYRDLTRPEPARKQNGEFKKNVQPKSQGKPGQPNPQQAAPQPAPQQVPAQPGAIDPNRVPDSWRGEAKAKWAGVDPLVRAEINKREADYRNGHAKLTQDIAAQKADVDFSRGLGQTLTPFLQGLQSKGVNVTNAVHDASKFVSVMHLGNNDDKLAALRNIVKVFGIQIPKAGAPTQNGTEPTQNGQPAPQPAPQPQVLRDPRVDALLAERAQTQQRERQASQQQIMTDVDKFANDPANDQFGIVYEEMAQLIENGMAKTPQEAYEKAVRLNPTAFSASQAKQVQQRQAEAARIATEARRAAGGPRSSGKPANFQPANKITDPKEKRQDIIASAVRNFVQQSGRS